MKLLIQRCEQIANKFNKFFVNVGSNLSRAIPKSNKDPRNFIQHTTYECFCVMPVNDEEVVKIISSFKDSSAGWDELKPGIIKNIKVCIVMPLAHICNLSFKRGVFPMQLKIANVVPIYKTGNEHVFSNYRPVSVLPVFSKLLERLMYIRLMNFITNNKLLYYGGVEGPPHIFFRHHAISYGWHNNSSVGDSNYCYVIRRTY